MKLEMSACEAQYLARQLLLRIAQQSQRVDWSLSTLAGLVGQCAVTRDPVVAPLKQKLLQPIG